ncbi:hypothetical protein [Methylobacterium sp. GC_Met_2]|uniref:hypothetical protein n=1 Tax=Methylobacterium sp. GC_Met_2 TaxID=2937376 RepID=UPI00226B5D9F|nr:hypothetical protein [Methylobacterium sp. GC_Met_2]
MARTLTLITLIACLVAPVAEAQPARGPIKPPPNAALKTRDTVLRDFDARMSRLDGLMGVPTAHAVRSRSAQAGR